MRFVFAFMLMLFILSLKAQNKSGNNWVFGGPFATRAVFVDTSRPAMIGKYANPYTYYIHGHSTISDSSTGKLLFSCNGMILYDSNCVMMENGDSLVPVKMYTHNAFPNGIHTQNSIILPKGSNGLYYVIVVAITDSSYDKGQLPTADRVGMDLLLYHIVDINANNGLGKVISKNNVLLSGKEMHKIGMMACRHANGRDWWLLKQGQYDTNQVIRFLVTPDSIAGPWIQNVTMWDPIAYKNVWDLDGQYAFSLDGSKFAYVKLYSQLYLADFDRCTGELYNSKLINIPIDTTPSPDPKYKYDSSGNGVCFSPNGQFVYISKRWNIYQYEHNEPDSSLAWYHIIQGPDTTYQKFQYYSSLHRGIDGRIYIGNWGAQHKQMSVIDKPDIKGVGCSFCRKCFRLDDTTYMGFGAPPDMPDFNLGASGQVCWPLSQSESEVRSAEWVVYPNPSSTDFIIQNKQGKKKELYNVQGELLFSTKEDVIDVKHLARGMYYLRVEHEVKKV
ncbi:MAG: T9SS type A sorting domain-containing protein, partial [Chitinophagaceae bacterium]|nr:T9SS type A sorting domain-containing protein [Chitinophagaceae bacterium]